MSNFSLSNRSWDRLRGVDPRLVGVVAYAITISEVDFTVLEGLRTAERQRELVAAGKSQTMNSRHLVGEAVDLGAWVDGTVSWDMEYYRKTFSGNGSIRAPLACLHRVGRQLEDAQRRSSFSDSTRLI